MRLSPIKGKPRRSGWFALLYGVPIVNIWPLMELGFLKGTVGENRLGSDTRAGPASAPLVE